MARATDLVCDALRKHLAGGHLAIPEHGRLAWRWFVDLHTSRTYQAATPNPISYADIEAYARLMRWEFMPRHVAMIRALDQTWLDHVRSGNAATPSRAPKGKVNPAVFDAVFG